MNISFEINGKLMRVQVSPSDFLIDVLREKLDLTGTKKGCEKGECGACSVIVDGLLLPACILLATKAHGTKITTIEGLKGPDGDLHPIQRAFLETGAIQCGYCTPGMVLATKVLLDTDPNPTEEEMKRAISGNLCRCTGYKKILAAMKRSAVYYQEEVDGHGDS